MAWLRQYDSPTLNLFRLIIADYALDTVVSRKCRHRSVDDNSVADLAARIGLYIWQVRSWSSLESTSSLGPHEVRSSGRVVIGGKFFPLASIRAQALQDAANRQ